MAAEQIATAEKAHLLGRLEHVLSVSDGKARHVKIAPQSFDTVYDMHHPQEELTQLPHAEELLEVRASEPLTWTLVSPAGSLYVKKLDTLEHPFFPEYRWLINNLKKKGIELKGNYWGHSWRYGVDGKDTNFLTSFVIAPLKDDMAARHAVALDAAREAGLSNALTPHIAGNNQFSLSAYFAVQLRSTNSDWEPKAQELKLKSAYAFDSDGRLKPVIIDAKGSRDVEITAGFTFDPEDFMVNEPVRFIEDPRALQWFVERNPNKMVFVGNYAGFEKRRGIPYTLLTKIR